MRARLAAATLALLAFAPLPAAAGRRPPPPAVAVDYQLGGDYRPPTRTRILVRDWWAGRPVRGLYNVCYVNGFQTQPDEAGARRPDERGAWSRRLVLPIADPDHPGEFLIDIRTPARRARAAARAGRWIRTCAVRGFDAVEIDNLDSWTRSGTGEDPGAPPFALRRAHAIAYARLLVRRAHAAGLAVAQKNAVELLPWARRIGFDFAIVEECLRYGECGDVVRFYGRRVIVIEYPVAPDERAGTLRPRSRDRLWAYRLGCRRWGERLSILLRDRALARRGARGYLYGSC